MSIAWAGCSREGRAGSTLHYDLFANLPLATVTREPGLLEVAKPEAEAYLASGWSRPERSRGSGTPFLWAVGEKSALRFPLVAARDLPIAFRCRPYRFRGPPRPPVQTVTLYANGQRVGEVELAPDPQVYRLVVPARFLIEGQNQLEFRYRHHQAPGQRVPGADPRPLAVAWYWIRVGEDGEGEGPRLRHEESPALVIPFGTQLDYYLEVPKDGALVVEGGAPPEGRQQGHLDVIFEVEDRGGRTVARVEAGERERVELPVEAPTVARLRLRAMSEEGGEEGGGFALRSAAVWAPEEAREPAGETPALAAGRDEPAAEALPARPPIVLHLVDTLRPDRLGCYGRSQSPSPRLDAFAREAIVFENAFAQSSWTKPSVASLFTGLWPPAHGANLRRDKLPSTVRTLPEILQEAGYRTAAFVGSPVVSRAFGFQRGFDEFFDEFQESWLESDGALIVERAKEWLFRHGAGGPFFLYVHTLDPHDPYNPPAADRERFAPQVAAEFARESGQLIKELRQGKVPPSPEIADSLLGLYDAEIAANDRAFGALLDALRQMGLYDASIVAFVSDHGEEFHEHGGWSHGRTLFGESVRVPFVLRLPGGAAARRVSEPVQHIDLLPTLLDLLDLPAMATLEGRSLLAAAAGDSAGAEGALFSYLSLDRAWLGPGSAEPHASILVGEWRLVEELEEGSARRRALYRWREDPGETRDLTGTHPILAGYLAARIKEKLLRAGDRATPEEAVIDERLAERLRALGYLP